MRKSSIVLGVAATLLLTVIVLLISPAAGAAPAGPSPASNADDRVTRGSPPFDPPARATRLDPASRVIEAYGKLPLYFEVNHGQSDSRVRFLARGPQQSLFLTPTEAVLVLTKREPPARAPATQGRPESRGPATGTALRMTFAGANPAARMTGREELPGKAHYFTGSDPAKWRTNVPTYAKVHYEEIYPGIDLVYHGNHRQLEYDLVVSPGADLGRIVLELQGADRLEVDPQGDLVLYTAAGAIRQRRPLIYQEVGGVRREIPGGYVLTGTHQVSFRVAAYDASQPLVIDPVLSYSTYLGGGSQDAGVGIAVDAAGNAYVTGDTLSNDFPTTAGTVQTDYAGGASDGFVTKLNSAGTALVYSTYLGGSGRDSGRGIALDAAGNAYVTGYTQSTDFPTVSASTTSLSGSADAFVAKLDTTGAALVYSTYLGEPINAQGFGIAVDSAGNAYVAGRTTSSSGDAFPFAAKLGPTSSVIYSRNLGGGGEFDTGAGIAVDGAGQAYVTGTMTPGGDQDAFVTKLSAGGSTLYSTLIGGSSAEQGYAIAVDAGGNAYVTGSTYSGDFPTTAGAAQTTLGASSDAFVTKLSPGGSVRLYSTYLGGSTGPGEEGGVDAGFGIAVDAAGNAYVTGFTGSNNFPTTAGAFQTTLRGSSDAFVTKLNQTGSAPLVYSTYLGGSASERGMGIAVVVAGNAYVTGQTDSIDFPTTALAVQTAGGPVDGFVAKIVEGPETFESRTEIAPAGGTVTTDTEGDGATAADPVETSVTTPNAGPVSITETNGGTPPSGYAIEGWVVAIEAPPATPANPLVIVFLIDSSIIPAGGPSSVQVRRNGIVVFFCSGAGASPDPCLASNTVLAGGDLRLEIRTSQASLWTFEVASSCSPTSCDDQDACTTDSCDSATGCTHTAVTCDDGDACTADSCDPATGCAHTAVSCNDGNACTAESCDPATGCAHTAVSCNDGNACTADSCDPATGCAHTAVSCNDGNACTADSCDPATGCAHTAVSCNDGNACTADACDPARGCTQAVVSCDDGNACTADSCDAASGCRHRSLEDCDQGDDDGDGDHDDKDKDKDKHKDKDHGKGKKSGKKVEKRRGGRE